MTYYKMYTYFYSVHYLISYRWLGAKTFYTWYKMFYCIQCFCSKPSYISLQHNILVICLSEICETVNAFSVDMEEYIFFTEMALSKYVSFLISISTIPFIVHVYDAFILFFLHCVADQMIL